MVSIDARTDGAVNIGGNNVPVVDNPAGEPAGTAQFSTNLCLSDPDHAVDPDERLSLVEVEGGTYDVRVVDSGKRMCLFHAVTLKSQGPYAFSISEQQMKTCTDH